MQKVKAGSTTIEIKEITNGKPCFRFYYYEGKKRKSKSSKDLDALKVEALAIARRLEGSKGRLMVSPDEIADFRKWQEDQNRPDMALGAVVKEFLAAKRATLGPNAPAVKILTTRLSNIVEHFGFDAPIGQIKAADIDRWIIDENPQWANQTRFNERRFFTQVWSWARDREYLPDKKTEAHKSTPYKPKVITHWFHPEDFPAILAEICPLRRSEAILTAFCGIRGGEIRRLPNDPKQALDWSAVDLDTRTITVPLEVAKTDRKRFSPIPENAFLMLKPLWKRSGPIHAAKYYEGASEWQRVAAKLKVEWHKNQLRQSFGSHRVGHLRDVGRVAEEMGNSPNIVSKHYDGRVRPELAKLWWEIVA